MIEKEYFVKRLGTPEWEDMIKAFTARKAAVQFVKKREDLAPEDKITVSENAASDGEKGEFVVSKLERSKPAPVEVPGELVEDKSSSVKSETKFSAETKPNVLDLRKKSAYLFVRSCVNFLAILLYCGAALYLIMGVSAGLAMKGASTATVFLGNSFVSVVSIVAIYVVQSLIHVFIDMADMMLLKSKK